MKYLVPCSLFLVAAGCASKGDAPVSSAPPDAPAASPSDPNAPKPRTALTVSGADPLRGKRLTAKEKPRDPGWKPLPVTPLPSFGVSRLYPTMAAPGSLVAVEGGGFAKGLRVEGAGGAAWDVVEVTAGRVVARVPEGAKYGPLTVKMGKRSAATKEPFLPLAKDGTFGRPVPRLDRGLPARVFTVPRGTKELPSFDDVGDPVGTLHLAGVDVPSGAFGGFSLRGTTVQSYVAMHAAGGLNVEKGAEYELCLESDDGAQLYLEQQLVVDNDGVHEAKKVCETVYLEPGLYRTDLLYFQAEGPVALRWTWNPDGAGETPVPADALFPE